MQHHFSVAVAQEYGLNEAILLENLFFWTQHNKENETNYHDGMFWTYNSVKAFERLFPYMKPSAIRRALKNLEESGLIVTGNYNSTPYDRTKWYALTEKANGFYVSDFSICKKMKMENTEYENQFEQISEPIPDRNTDNKPIDKQDREKRKRFTAPTVEEVTQYIDENGYSVDPCRFVEYYTSNGWKVGKNQMKDWKAAVRTWHYRDNPRKRESRAEKELQAVRDEIRKIKETARKVTIEEAERLYAKLPPLREREYELEKEIEGGN